MKNGVHLQGFKGYMLRRNRYNINTLLITNPLMPL